MIRQLTVRSTPKTKKVLCSLLVKVMLVSCIFSGSQAVGDAPAPAPQANCPLKFDTLALSDIANKTATPYIFGGQQKPSCTKCNLAPGVATGLDTSLGALCKFERTSLPRDSATCTAAQKSSLIDSFVSRHASELLQFSPCDLWPYLAGRTLWVLGDSEALNMFEAFECFMYEFWTNITEFDTSITENNPHFQALANQTYASPPLCVIMPQQTRICYMRVNRPEVLVSDVLPILEQLGTVKDIALMNVGIWVGDTEVEAYKASLQQIINYALDRATTFPRVLWKDTAPQHFPADNSNSTACSAQVTLQDDGTLTAPVSQASDPWIQNLLRGGYLNVAAQEVFGAANFPIVSTWNETMGLYTDHILKDDGSPDCIHYCQPSAYQIWIYSLFKTLKGLNVALA